MAETGHETDNRWAHRPRLDWSLAERRSDLRTVAGRVFSGLAHLARVRASLPHLHASIPSEVLPMGGGGVLALVRRSPIGPMVALYNVTREMQVVPSAVVFSAGLHTPYDALSRRPVTPDPDGNYWLTPYAAWWLVDAG